MSVAEQVPRDVLIIIFGHLNARWLKRVALVSKRWHVAASDDSLWFQLCYPRHGKYAPTAAPPVPGECPWRWKAEYLERQHNAVGRDTSRCVRGPHVYPVGDPHALPRFAGMLWLYCVDPDAVQSILRTAKHLPSNRAAVAAAHLQLASIVMSGVAALATAAAFAYARGTLSQFAAVFPALVCVDTCERQLERTLLVPLKGSAGTRSSGMNFGTIRATRIMFCWFPSSLSRAPLVILMILVVLFDSFSSATLLRHRVILPLYARVAASYFNASERESSIRTRALWLVASTAVAAVGQMVSLHVSLVAVRAWPELLCRDRLRPFIATRCAAWLWLAVALAVTLL